MFLRNSSGDICDFKCVEFELTGAILSRLVPLENKSVSAPKTRIMSQILRFRWSDSGPDRDRLTELESVAFKHVICIPNDVSRCVPDPVVSTRLQLRQN